MSRSKSGRARSGQCRCHQYLGPAVVPVRLDPELKEAVETRAEREQTTTSEIIREAIRRFLDVA